MNHVPVYQMTEEELLSRVIYRDQLVIVMNKPVNMPVHPGPKGGPSFEDHFTKLQFGYKEVPKLAHRLDRDTSGCLVLGRNDRAVRRMGKMFEGGQVNKTYWAVTETAPAKTKGTINTCSSYIIIFINTLIAYSTLCNSTHWMLSLSGLLNN